MTARRCVIRLGHLNEFNLKLEQFGKGVNWKVGGGSWRTHDLPLKIPDKSVFFDLI